MQFGNDVLAYNRSLISLGENNYNVYFYVSLYECG